MGTLTCDVSDSVMVDTAVPAALIGLVDFGEAPLLWKKGVVLHLPMPFDHINICVTSAVFYTDATIVRYQ